MRDHAAPARPHDQSYPDGAGGHLTIVDPGDAVRPAHLSMVLPPGYGPPVALRHPRQSEAVYVRKGHLFVNIDGQYTLLGPGQSVLIPADTWHHSCNPSADEPVEADFVLSPGLDIDRMFARLFTAKRQNRGLWRHLSMVDVLMSHPINVRFQPPVHLFFLALAALVRALRGVSQGVPRALAAIYGALCNGLFLLAVCTMAGQLYFGMHAGPVALPGPLALLWDLGLVAQFVALHSWMLSRRGAATLRIAAPAAVGSTLDTTLYATAASLQVALLFGLWAPLGAALWSASGALGWAARAGFALGWALLLAAMIEAGVGLQTGATGWLALWKGEKPAYPKGFPLRGLHAACRHPIYAAFALILWMGPHWSLDRLLLALPLTAYCIVGPRKKEARTLARHGEAYAAYLDRTPAFLPRLWR